MSKEKETGNRRPSLSGFRVCAGSGVLFETATIKAKPPTVLLPVQNAASALSTPGICSVMFGATGRVCYVFDVLNSTLEPVA